MVMKISAYNHFKQLFCHSDEFIICADKRLSIVYATDRVHPIFSKDDKPLLNLGCILSINDCDTVQKSLCDTPHSVSFDFISIIESVPRRCVVIPMLFGEDYYYVLHISNTKARAIEKLQQQDIETIVNATMKQFADYSAPIIQFANTLDDGNRQIIMSSMCKIIKLLKNIQTVTVNNTASQSTRVIDLYGYVQRLFNKIQNRLGKDRFQYSILPCHNIYLSQTNTDALDMMAVNIVTEMFLLCNKTAQIFVKLCGDRQNNFIIISNDRHGLGYTPEQLLEQNENTNRDGNDCRQIISRTICAKVARECGAKAFFTSTFGGGVTHGVMLKRARPRQTTLYDNLEDYNDNYELLDILLADI